MASDKLGFLEELKHRHVWRVAVAYAIAAWLLVLAIGFVVAVVFAWIFELTPEDIRRTAAADAPDARPEHETRQIGRKLNAVIIAVLMLAVALMG